jgi:hypothetical protein
MNLANQIYKGLRQLKPEERMIRTISMTRFWIATGLAVGLAAGTGYAQTAGQDMKDAGRSTKNAAVDTGHATSRTTKRAYHSTKRGTKKAYRKTASGTRTAGHRTANAGDAIAGKPETHPQ